MTNNDESTSLDADRTEQVDTLDLLVEQTKESSNEDGLWCVEMVRGPMIGERVVLKQGKTTFGRSPDCDVFLDDITVSRHHCDLALSDSDIVSAIDQGSTNGTYVNSNAVEKTELEAGDVVQIGRYVFLLTRRSAQ